MAMELLPAVRNATNAVKLDTLLAAVPRVVATEADMVADMVVANRLAILAAVSATWPVIAPKARSATTVS